MQALQVNKSNLCAFAINTILLFGTPLNAQQEIDSNSDQAFETDTVNIYCISNFDGTGDCINTSTNAPFDCTLIPGQVIACKDADKNKFSCIIFGSIQSNQAYFQCTPRPI